MLDWNNSKILELVPVFDGKVSYRVVNSEMIPGTLVEDEIIPVEQLKVGDAVTVKEVEELHDAILVEVRNNICKVYPVDHPAKFVWVPVEWCTTKPLTELEVLATEIDHKFKLIKNLAQRLERNNFKLGAELLEDLESLSKLIQELVKYHENH